ncbi:MAG TPA: FIST N-terminal domain-containing protein [Anaerolineales bacterium]|nr:FIST N-terminal domain-containing protein [Anaerolineales bacterium]
MTLTAVVGQAQALEGREAAAQATHRALDQIGRNQAVFGIVIASRYHAIQQVLTGASTLLGDIPLLGLSTNAEITEDGQSQRSVVVALLAGDGISVKADWWGGFGEDSRGVAQRMTQTLQLYHSDGTLLVVADGFNGDAKQFCAGLPAGEYTLAGCLAGGALNQARTYQIGGRQSGTNGLAAALISGKVVTGVGYAHGWQTVGSYYRVTRSQGPWVRMLNEVSVAEAYSRLFKYPARQWAFPPLNELVRLYPLGIEQKASDPLLVRSPLRMETDGSLRMNTLIPEGATAHLLVGSIQNCLEAAKQAAQAAIDSLNGARPVLALIFADIAWQMLFESNAGQELQVIREVLGPDVPIAGGYTFGQIARVNKEKKSAPELLNQQIEIVLFGAP